MKKLLVFLMLSPVSAFAWMGFGGGTDYSRDASSTYYCADLAGTAVTTAAGLNRTNPALTLVNPNGSNKNLVLLEVGIDVTASPAAAVGFMLAYSTGAATIAISTTATAAIITSTYTTVTPALIMNTVPSTTTIAAMTQGQCLRGGTLPNTPVAFRYLGGTTGAAAIGGVVLTDYTNGKVVIPPGSVVSIQSTSAASIIAHFLWREDNL